MLVQDGEQLLHGQGTDDGSAADRDYRFQISKTYFGGSANAGPDVNTFERQTAQSNGSRSSHLQSMDLRGEQHLNNADARHQRDVSVQQIGIHKGIQILTDNHHNTSSNDKLPAVHF